MSTETHTIPDDILIVAREAYHSAFNEYGNAKDQDVYEAIAKAIHDAVMAERERCARVIEEGYDRGIARKMDMCAHSKFEWEDCDECAVAAIRAAPKAEG